MSGGGSGPALLSVSDVTVTYGGVHAVNSVSLSVDKGEVVGLVGPNGAGKSTLFGAMAGAVPLTRGTVMLNGARISGLPVHKITRLGVARTFQKIRLFDSMSAEENVMVSARVRERSASAAGEIAHAALDMSQFRGDRSHRVSSLPLADRKRVEIARAIAAGPQLLLLDEMMNGLTPEETDALVASIKELPDHGITVMLVEHVLHVVRSLCTRLVVLHHGTMIADGIPHDVLSRPEVVEAWLGGTALGSR